MSLSIRGLTPLPRFVARVRGERALAFLHDTTTQDVAGLGPGSGALTCVLDEKGGVHGELRLLVLDDAIVLDGEQAARDAVFGRLARVAPLSGVTIDETHLTVTAARGLAIEAPETEHAWIAHGDALLVRTGEGVDIIGPVGFDAPDVAFEDFEAARIAAGLARFGVDISPGMLINETPLLARAVSFTKGCYPGQESVARVHNLGSIRRRFVSLSFDGGAPPMPSTLDDGLGTVTSAARGAAIGVVRASVEVGARVQAGETAFTIDRALH